MLETVRIIAIEYALSIVINIFALILLAFKFAQLPLSIPFWYTQSWGRDQFANKIFLILIPVFTILATLINGWLAYRFFKKNDLLPAKALGLFTIIYNIFLYLSLYRIIAVTTTKTPLPWFLEPKIMLPMTAAFLLSFALTPLNIKFANRLGLIDNPKTHRHPAMLLTRAVPRAGTTPIIIAILLSSLLFIPFSRPVAGIMAAAFISLATGLIDDKYDLSPYLRFASQILSAVIVIYSGLQITYINNPTGGVIPITEPNFKINFLNPIYPVAPLAIIATILWIIWTMNMLSWSNGIDGQFPGIVTVVAVVIGLLSVRDESQKTTMLLSFITAGAILGTVPFTWHKSHMLYGFGATSIGLILASLSILSGTKVATSLLVLMVPTLDALFAIIRRIKKGQSPFWGDRAHLHHKLLDLGFSQTKIALFYWLVSIVLGLLATYSSGSGKLLAILTAAGTFSFLLIIVNAKEKRDARENRI